MVRNPGRLFFIAGAAFGLGELSTKPWAKGEGIGVVDFIGAIIYDDADGTGDTSR